MWGRPGGVGGAGQVGWGRAVVKVCYCILQP